MAADAQDRHDVADGLFAGQGDAGCLLDQREGFGLPAVSTTVNNRHPGEHSTQAGRSPNGHTQPENWLRRSRYF